MSASDTTTPDLQALIELLPCPFCGGKAHLERQGHVACMTPGCRGFGAFDNSGTPSEQNGSAAVRWNTRQTAPTLPGAGGGDALDARRWRHARRLFTIDDIEGAQGAHDSFGGLVSEEECVRADAAIDAALPPQQGG